MPTNLVGQPAEFVIDAYHQLWRIEKAVRIRYRTSRIKVSNQTLTAADPLSDDLRDALLKIAAAVRTKLSQVEFNGSCMGRT